jgi:hypothetical protein
MPGTSPGMTTIKITKTTPCKVELARQPVLRWA